MTVDYFLNTKHFK